ncbi:S41 family peptidase [Streptomyces sp. ICBB 8177]|uniref:S41 family peptidase n=1 Tax=Streptomyces sp. ICBB 8177 TaxID=563922 RepID=UPI001F544CA9|nr:S41 family peptidase [Streptomyces sp. ICBB 8177]
MLPTGRVVRSVGYVRLPGLPGGRRLARRYTATGGELLDGLASARPVGWILDLRSNGGGNMWPMLAVVAPLLDEGPVGRFVRADGGSEVWALEHGRVLLDSTRMARSLSSTGGPRDVPLAVLTSKGTASAGEAVAVACRGEPVVRFLGTPTADFTTGNLTRVLRDGTRLHITSAHYADRTGRLIVGPLAVDETVGDSDPRAAVRAALTWIHRRCDG